MKLSSPKKSNLKNMIWKYVNLTIPNALLQMFREFLLNGVIFEEKLSN